jgi:hypothetical protein
VWTLESAKKENRRYGWSNGLGDIEEEEKGVCGEEVTALDQVRKMQKRSVDDAGMEDEEVQDREGKRTKR